MADLDPTDRAGLDRSKRKIGELDSGPTERGRKWLEQNREALASSNAYVEKHGLPLAGRRLF